jgi:hypothetical protein
LLIHYYESTFMKPYRKTNLYEFCKRHVLSVFNFNINKDKPHSGDFLTDIIVNTDLKYVSYICKGDFNYNKFTGGFDKLADVCHENNYKGVLFDMSGLNNPLPDWDRYKAGEAIANKLMGIKIASFSKASFTNGFTINVAYNRGINIKVFIDKDEALKWLLN